ncbi:uncharacterized protein [Palaemon carinicauda]|uniref:uncharacterized protein isoform X2 n=1 Tax=Palaemon carinicauda TaxID=392227 RepID=UPI0035B58A98
MTVRHIDFMKIKPSNILMVEVRPLRCSIATSSGLIKTAKWMSYEHWKELHLLLSDVATLYQESKVTGSTQEVKCYERKMMYGNLIKIGYMFVAQNSYMCCHVIPMNDATWSDEDDDEDKSLEDEDARCEELIPCGVRLIVSVELQSHQSLLQSDKQLSKALDSCLVVLNTLSDSNPSSRDNCMVSDSSLLLHNDEQGNLKGMIGKSHSRFKQLFPKIQESISDLDHDRIRSRKLIFDTSEESTDYNAERLKQLFPKIQESNSDLDHDRIRSRKPICSTSEESIDNNAELVTRRLDQDVNHLFKDIVNRYPSQTENCIYDNGNSEEEKLFIKEEMGNERAENSEIQEKLFIMEEMKSELVEDTGIPLLSDELQGVCDNSQLLLCDHLFNLDGERPYDSKDEEKCIDYETVNIVKSEGREVFNNPAETELVSNHKSNVKCGVPPNYTLKGKQVLLVYDGEIEKKTVNRTSVSHNEEPMIRNSLQHSERNTFKRDESLIKKHCVLSLEKNSSKSILNPVIENRKSELCEMVNYSLTDITQLSMTTSNPVSIKETSTSDEDSCQKNYSKIFTPNSSYPQSDNNDVGQPIVVSVPLQCLRDTTLSHVLKKAKLRGRRKKKSKKLQHLFGKDEGSIIEKIKPKEPFIREDSELNSGEYVPTVKKSFQGNNITDKVQPSHPEYTPSPIDREQATKQLKKKVSSKKHNSEDPDYKCFCNQTLVENEGDASFRRSKRLQWKDTKGFYAYDVLFFNEEMDEFDDLGIILNQDVKEDKKKEIKIVEEGSLESSESAGIGPRKVIRGCKRTYKRKQPCKNSKILEGVKDNQEHNFVSKKNSSRKSTFENTKRMSAIESKLEVVEVKDSQENSGNRGRGKRKQGIVESEKTREGKIVLHEVMQEIEEARKRRLEDNPLSGYISGTQLLNENSETENISGVVNKLIKTAKCSDVEKFSKLTKANSSKKLIVTASLKKECSNKSNRNIKSEKKVECKKIKKIARCKPSSRKEFQEHRKNRNKSYTKRPGIDMLGESSMTDICCKRKIKKNNSQDMKLYDDLSFSNKDSDKIPVQNENITLLNTSHPPLTSLDEGEYLKTCPLIDHLKKCKTKLTMVSASELSERLELANEYLNAIINEKTFNKKHERRQYIWKVLVPCFFIKLTMDILNIENEKEAQDTLRQISMNFAE